MPVRILADFVQLQVIRIIGQRLGKEGVRQYIDVLTLTLGPSAEPGFGFGSERDCHGR